MNSSDRKARAAARKAQDERLRRCREATAAEMSGLAGAIAAARRGERAYPIMESTGFGTLSVTGINHAEDMILAVCKPGRERDSLSQTSAYLCQDGRWSAILASAGVARHPLFA